MAATNQDYAPGVPQSIGDGLFTNNPNRANPVEPRKNQPAMNWCAPVKRKIPAASDETNMKSQVKLPTHQTIRHCLSRSCVCVSVSIHYARCW